MSAKTLMIQGSMSSAGKSILVTALCRIFARQGVKVAPFKAQNMSNNAAVCADGGEIGRAQYTQALAAGIEPTIQMNPVLLKPEADMRSQVIVNGRVWQTVTAYDYYERKQILWSHVTTALDALRSQADLVIIEVAGSPAELNLKRGDIVNMAVAKYAKSPVLLAGDIDRGGIFAQLLGTLMLLDSDERALVKGMIVNKFRGDPALFEDGITILEEKGNIPVLGVIPYIKDHGIPEEDAVAIETRNNAPIYDIDIAVIALPRIANFDDFDPLKQAQGVGIRYVSHVDELKNPTAVIIPGTKSTIDDLAWMNQTGLAQEIVEFAKAGGVVVGICGGYQMLGQSISDPLHIESTQQEINGLGLLPTKTTFLTDKTTTQTQSKIISNIGWLANLQGETISGYEIHMGQTDLSTPWLQSEKLDGGISPDGRIWGCYLHGLFANDNLRAAWLKSLGWQGSIQPSAANPFDYFADQVEQNLDMTQLKAIIGL